MNLFLLSNYLVTITSLVIILLLALYGKTKIHRAWTFCNIAIFCWGIGTILFASTEQLNLVIIGWKIALVGGYFISTFYYHTVYLFAGNRVSNKDRIFLVFSYLFMISSAIFTLVESNLVISHFRLVFGSIYYPTVGLGYSIIFSVWALIALVASYKLFNSIKLSKGIERTQAKYLLFAFVIGYIGGGSVHLPSWGVKVYPIGNFAVAFYTIIVTYAILKHHLMDIRIAVTRAGIFLFVYAFVLGIPFWIGFITKRWFFSTASAVVLATIGPFIYSRLRQRAEDILLANQKRYQKALLTLSRNMHEVKELDKLLRLILAQVVRHLKLREAAIYLLNKDDSAFELKASFPKAVSLFQKEIPANSAFIAHLKQKDTAFLSEELSSKEYSELLKNQGSLGMIVPCTTRDELVSFMALGPKPKDLIYNELDINIFRILSLQAGLAIENCLFWQNEKVRIAKEEQIRRQKSLDHFSASLVHEIGNPVFAAQSGVKRLQMWFEQDIKSLLSAEQQAYFEDKIKRPVISLDRVNKIFKAVKEFASQTTGEFSLIKIDEVMETFLIIFEAIVKHEKVLGFKTALEPGIKMWGNKIYLEEVLMNLGANAVHAVQGREDKNKHISVDVHKHDKDRFRIKIQDNGYGIEKHLLQDIFLDFVTTKASTEGTGMGLVRVRKIVELHKGKIWAESEGKDKGATFFVELPLTKEK